MTFRASKHPIVKWFFPALVLLIIGGVYLVFVYINLFPQLERLQYFSGPSSQESIEESDPHLHKASVAEVVGVTTAFHVLFFLFLVSFFRSILTPPGTIPDTPKWRKGNFNLYISAADEEKLNELMSIESPHALDIRNPYLLFFLRMFPLVERKKKKFGCYRQCQKEGNCKNMWKPDRCHHCAVCDSCILRMDHHCPWIANCVGFHNYKFFFLLLVYALSCLAFMLGALFPRLIKIFQPILDYSYFLRRDLLVLLVYIICLFFFITLAMFFGFHVWLVLHAMTTIEYKEKALVKHLFRVTRVKYDYGYYRNLVHVLGPPYMWLLPIAPPPLHFLSLQRQYLLNLTNAKENSGTGEEREPQTRVSGFESQTRLLAEQLASPKARQEAMQDAGCYYTPYSSNIQLWYPSYETEDRTTQRKAKPKKKIRLRTHEVEGDGPKEEEVIDTRDGKHTDFDLSDDEEEDDEEEDDGDEGEEEDEREEGEPEPHG